MKKNKNKKWLAVILLAFFLLPFLTYVYLKYGESQKIVNYVNLHQLFSRFHGEHTIETFLNRPFLVHFEDNEQTQKLIPELFKEVAKDTLFNVLTFSKIQNKSKPYQANWSYISVNENEYDSLARYVFHLVNKEISNPENDSLTTDNIVLVNHRHFIIDHLRLTNEDEKDKLVFSLKKMILKQESSKIFQ